MGGCPQCRGAGGQNLENVKPLKKHPRLLDIEHLFGYSSI
jgi:hypothetical protein